MIQACIHMLMLTLVLCASQAIAHADYEQFAGTVTTDGGELKIYRHYTDGIFFGDPVRVIFRSEKNGWDVESTKFADEVAIQFSGNSPIVYSYGSILKSPVATKIQRFESMNLIDVSGSWSKIISPVVLVLDHMLQYTFAASFFLIFLIPVRWSIRKTLSVPVKAKWLFVILTCVQTLFVVGYLAFIGIMGVSPIMVCVLGITLALLLRAARKLAVSCLSHLRTRSNTVLQ